MLFEDWIREQSWLLNLNIQWDQLIQIFILGAFAFWVYTRFIRRSDAEQLLKGLFVILLLFVAMFSLALFFELDLLVAVMGFSIQVLIFALIVIFQPELRRMLFYLGQPEFLGERLFSMSPVEQKAEYLVNELTEVARFLSKSKTGALIVLESANDSGTHYLEAGTQLDAQLSTELILTIFHPNTPLHDGAMIINPENRITAAGVLLPLTEDPKLSWQYGTRHRAAVGLSEVSDSYCLVVSEETGNISLVNHGTLEKMDSADNFKTRLEKVYRVNVSTKSKNRAIPTQVSSKVASFGERLANVFSVESLPSGIQRLFQKPSRSDLKEMAAQNKIKKSSKTVASPGGKPGVSGKNKSNTLPQTGDGTHG